MSPTQASQTASFFYQVGCAFEKPFTTCSNTKEYLWEKANTSSTVGEIAFRIATVAFTILTFPVTYVLAALGSGIKKLSLPNVPHSSSILTTLDKSYRHGVEISHKIAKLQAENLPGWKEMAATHIRKNREDDLDNEWERLQGSGITNTWEIAQAANSVAIEKPTAYTSHLRRMTKVLLGQAQELKNVYKDTHDVFIHAQSLKWAVIPKLIKELTKEYKPETVVSHFKFLRTEGSTIPDSLLEMVGCWIWGPSKTHKSVQAFLAANGKIDDRNPKIREKVLSVDAYFYNTQRYESALHFLINNSNILNAKDKDSIKNIASAIMKIFAPHVQDSEIARLSSKLLGKTKFTDLLATTGNLYVIAVPKAISPDVQYRAHPVADVCRCHRGAAVVHETILNNLQNDILSSNETCKNYDTLFTCVPIPQYRLYTPLVTPESGIKIFRLNALTRDNTTRIKTVVKDIVAELKTAFTR